MTANKELAVQFLHDLGKASPAMFELLTDDAEYHIIAELLGVGPFIGKQVIREQFFPLLQQLFPNALAFTIHNVIAEGNFVAVECSSHAEISDGKVYANRYHWLFEFAGDRIAKVKEYNDSYYVKETLMPG